MKNTTIAAALLACILATGAARAEDPEVEARFEKGVALYKEADFRSAVVEFRRAYDRSKNPKILYNIAQCEYQLTNYVAAQAAFEKYLADGGSDVPATRREDVEGELQKLKARIALVTIKVDKPGAAVTVDEMRVGVSPLPAPMRRRPSRSAAVTPRPSRSGSSSRPPRRSPQRRGRARGRGRPRSSRGPRRARSRSGPSRSGSRRNRRTTSSPTRGTSRTWAARGSATSTRSSARSPSSRT